MKKTHNYTQADILGELTPREKVVESIKSDHDTRRRFGKLKPEQQENIITFLSGERGLEVLLDSFFQKIFNPMENKDRICSLLSALIGQEVEDFTMLPREGNPMYEKGSLVIMDILVRLKDGSFVDVEMQKIGYRFPSQRSTCYASDLVMRQYNALRAEHGDEFSYDMIRPVNIFVIIESPSKEFSETGSYIHRRQVSYSSGIKFPESVNICYITLDSFRKSIQNINEPLDKWLAFFTYKEPKEIISLVNKYPEFFQLYHEISEFRRNPKEAITMYSEALAVLDHNTELFMIKEAHQEIEELKLEKDTLLQEKDSIRQENDALQQENDSLQQENDSLQQENDSLQQEKDALQQKLAKYEAKYGKL